MIERPMDVLKNFPVRKNKQQKQAFRDAVQSYAESLGYPVSIEKGSFGAHNVVIGSPETARYLVTAHYDTPARLPFPNLITPTNPITYLLYQFIVIGLYVLISVVIGVVLSLATDNQQLGTGIALLVYWVMLFLMLLGPANRSNANDNTSGVVTVLETAASMPEEYRDKVCFVLFDLEEAGLIGSADYRKAHKKESDSQIILNLDCVGDGNEIMLFPTPKLKKDSSKMELLRKMTTSANEKSVTLHEKGFYVYPSDQKNFPHGVGIAAFRRSKWFGLYCDKIHTGKDTILEDKNVSILRDSILNLITAA